jgi:hypothetical protein
MFTKTAGNTVVGRVFAIPEFNGMGVTLHNATGSTIALGDVMEWDFVYSATAEQQEQAILPVTSTTILRQAVVAMESVADGAIGKFQYKGWAEVYVYDASTLAAGRMLEVKNQENELDDGGGTTRVQEAVGFLYDAYVAADSGTNTLKTCYLFGERHTIKAS